MALKDDILEYISRFPGATDTELEQHLNKNHQHINITCRKLEQQGYMERQANPDKGAFFKKGEKLRASEKTQENES